MSEPTGLVPIPSNLRRVVLLPVGLTRPLGSGVVLSALAGSFVAEREAPKASDVSSSRFLVSAPSTRSLTLEWS
jgi:hypothetical protein